MTGEIKTQSHSNFNLGAIVIPAGASQTMVRCDLDDNFNVVARGSYEFLPWLVGRVRRPQASVSPPCTTHLAPPCRFLLVALALQRPSSLPAADDPAYQADGGPGPEWHGGQPSGSQGQVERQAQHHDELRLPGQCAASGETCPPRPSLRQSAAFSSHRSQGSSISLIALSARTVSTSSSCEPPATMPFWNASLRELAGSRRSVPVQMCVSASQETSRDTA